ncbi:MAG: glycine--tRNA ligase subunit beta, partial [Pseudomonadales bacterium]|nr:glycine--tRNA ligase subunit beta [Pseudomonadales bacterium]
MTADFLVEIGCEELPPKSLKELEAAFLDGITKKLQLARVNFSNATSFSTPRRLAVLVSDLDTTTPVEQQLIWGPPI